MAIRPYSSPGVTVIETSNPSIASLLLSPSILAIVGEAKGKQLATETLTLTGNDPTQTANQFLLKYSGVNSASVIVKSPATGEVHSPGTYLVAVGTDPDTSVSGDEPYTIARRVHPTSAPGVAIGTGTLTGTYVYAFSYVNAAGETGVSPTSAPITLTNQGVNLSAITAGPAGTTARNVYRKKTSSGGDNKFHLVSTIADNVTTSVTGETTTDLVAQGDMNTTFGTLQPKAGIDDGGSVLVTYEYTDEFYYEATLFDDYNDVTDKYGAPFDGNGNIDSKLSFAARLAFINGATEVICVATKGAITADYENALIKLEDSPEARMITTTGGSAAIGSAVAAHVNKMNQAGLHRIGIIGRDGVAAAVTSDTLRQAARALNNEAIVFVSPASFQMTNPVTGKFLNVGGQFMAAAVGGMYAARDVQVPLTRKTIAGFENINDRRTAADLVLDSSAGLLATEIKGGVIRVRHDITTAVGAVNSRETSLVRAKYEMAHRIKEVLDSSVIGIVVPRKQAPLVVRGAVVSVLTQLTVEDIIHGYSDVTARQLVNDPTTIEVRFAYDPAYPINNIIVVFTINTNTGEFTLV